MNRQQLEAYAEQLQADTTHRVSFAFRYGDLLNADDYRIEKVIVAINNYPHAEIGVDWNTQDLTPVADYIGKITGYLAKPSELLSSVMVALPPGNTVYSTKDIDIHTFEYGGQLNYVISGVSMDEIERNPEIANAVTTMLQRLFDRYRLMKGK